MLYVPKTLSPDHKLVHMIGFQAAQKLVRAFGGEILYPAACTELDRAERNRAIIKALRDGGRIEAVAMIFGVSVRHVRNMRRAAAEMVSEEQRAVRTHDERQVQQAQAAS